MEDTITHKKYAIKKIICHGLEDQRLAAKEIEYYNLVKHPNVIECIDSTYKGTIDPIINATSEVLIILPYYHVSYISLCYISIILYIYFYKNFYNMFINVMIFNETKYKYNNKILYHSREVHLQMN